MKKLLALALLCAAILPAFGQRTQNAPYVKVRITPTKQSWDYNIGEPIKMQVSIEKGELPLPNVAFRYEAGPEMLPAGIKKEANTGKGSVVLDLGKMDKPGFYTLNVFVEVDGVKYDQYKTVGVERDKIEPTVKMPADFQSWWKAQVDADRKLPLKAVRRLLPERCTDKVDVYEISYVPSASSANGLFYGILCVPRAPGRYPAVLRVPGAGVRPYNGDVGLAARGFITLEVGIHGIPVTLDQKVYDNLRYGGALTAYNSMNIESRESYYYNRVYRGCRRAVDYIFSLDEFDGKNVGVAGGSQGGALTLVVAALDERVVAAVSHYPALSDIAGYLYGRAGGWPHILRNPEGNVYNNPRYIETLSYYDAVNFARILRAPVKFMMGYNDKVCPPTSTFSAYNACPAPKEVVVVNEVGHWLYPEQYEQTNQFLIDRLTK